MRKEFFVDVINLSGENYSAHKENGKTLESR